MARKKRRSYVKKPDAVSGFVRAVQTTKRWVPPTLPGIRTVVKLTAPKQDMYRKPIKIFTPIYHWDNSENPIKKTFRKGAVPTGKHDGRRGRAAMVFTDSAVHAKHSPKARAAKKEDAERPARSAEERNCKKRPDSKMARKGSGGSREFIPWC